MAPDLLQSHRSYENSTRVLIVDDDKAHANVVAKLLNESGYPCDVAESGLAALSQIDGKNYDVIVTELVLNQTDGLEILRHSQETQPDAGVVMLTGHASIQSAVAAGQLGVRT